MKKLKLNIDDLKVESFEIGNSRNSIPKGTVKGQEQESGGHICWVPPVTSPNTCQNTCGNSCEGSCALTCDDTCGCNGPSSDCYSDGIVYPGCTD